jgi:hypothetical protein
MALCPFCGSEQRDHAVFCDQCGTRISRAGMPTERLSAPVEISWVRIASYQVRLIEWDDGPLEDAPDAPWSVVCEVEYQNDSVDPLSYGLGQWLLYDTLSYAHEFELITRFYRGREVDRLASGLLLPGKQVRGLVAFQIPAGRSVAYLQFRPGHLSKEAAEFPL